MGMNLSRLEDGELFECSNGMWGIIMASAYKTGWKPLGTFKMDENDNRSVASFLKEAEVKVVWREEERTKVLADSVTANSRPFWLLEKPLRLVLNNGKLYHRQVIGIISGPERIETYWWSGKEVQRDYYIAREHCGSRIWIFRERIGERNWYLHGYFS